MNRVLNIQERITLVGLMIRLRILNYVNNQINHSKPEKRFTDIIDECVQVWEHFNARYGGNNQKEIEDLENAFCWYIFSYLCMINVPDKFSTMFNNLISVDEFRKNPTKLGNIMDQAFRLCGSNVDVFGRHPRLTESIILFGSFPKYSTTMVNEYTKNMICKPNELILPNLDKLLQNRRLQCTVPLITELLDTFSALGSNCLVLLKILNRRVLRWAIENGSPELIGLLEYSQYNSVDEESVVFEMTKAWSFREHHARAMFRLYKEEHPAEHIGIYLVLSNDPPINTKKEQQRLRKNNRAKLARRVLRETEQALAVNSCLQRQSEGFGFPDCVLQSTEAHKTESDTLANFFKDRIFIMEGTWVSSNDIQKEYSDYCYKNGIEFRVTQNRIADHLKSLGCISFKHRGVRGWLGCTINHKFSR